MDNWLTSISDWLVELVKAIFLTIGDILYDFVVKISDAFLSVVSFLISSLPVPDFLSSHSLSAMFSAVDPTILYFISALGIPEGLGFISVAVGFRLLRKFVTLFQW